MLDVKKTPPKNQRYLFSYHFGFIVLIISSSGMYIVEKDIQPDKFGSIPQSMWWSIVTLTTVGYGDVYPVTSMGKFFGSIIIILGIGTVALPSGILASAFTEYTRRNQKKYEDKLKFMLSDNIIDDKEKDSYKEIYETFLKKQKTQI